MTRHGERKLGAVPSVSKSSVADGLCAVAGIACSAAAEVPHDCMPDASRNYVWCGNVGNSQRPALRAVQGR